MDKIKYWSIGIFFSIGLQSIKKIGKIYKKLFKLEKGNSLFKYKILRDLKKMFFDKEESEFVVGFFKF